MNKVLATAMMISATGHVKEYGEWVECLRPILNDMREEFGDELMIYYSW